MTIRRTKKALVKSEKLLRKLLINFKTVIEEAAEVSDNQSLGEVNN